MPERVPGQADEAWAREHARWHGAFIEKALEAVGAYSGAALARRLQGINPRATIDERIEALDVIIRSGREQGYFLIP